jgi:hypothetical protein
MMPLPDFKTVTFTQIAEYICSLSNHTDPTVEQSKQYNYWHTNKCGIVSCDNFTKKVDGCLFCEGHLLIHLSLFEKYVLEIENLGYLIDSTVKAPPTDLLAWLFIQESRYCNNLVEIPETYSETRRHTPVSENIYNALGIPDWMRTSEYALEAKDAIINLSIVYNQRLFNSFVLISSRESTIPLEICKLVSTQSESLLRNIAEKEGAPYIKEAIQKFANKRPQCFPNGCDFEVLCMIFKWCVSTENK